MTHVDLSPELALEVLMYTNWDTENSAHRTMTQLLSAINAKGETVSMDVIA